MRFPFGMFLARFLLKMKTKIFEDQRPDKVFDESLHFNGWVPGEERGVGVFRLAQHALS